VNWFKACLWILLSSIATAQKFPSQQYTDQDVLPNNTVRALFKSTDGALWIGTDNGLVRNYNEQITTFFKEDGLTQNNIWAIAQDQHDRLWVGSYGQGISIFQNQRFTAFPSNEQLPNQEITKLFLGKKSLYVGTSDGIAIIDLDDVDKVQALRPSLPVQQKFQVQDFFTVGSTVYAVSYAHGIYKIEEREKETVLSLITRELNLYAAYREESTLYLSGKERYKKLPINSINRQGVVECSKGLGHSVIWDYQRANDKLYAAAWGIYAADGGVYEITETGMQLKNKAFGVESTQVTSLAYDKELRLLYVGTLDQGYYEVRLDQNIQYVPVSHDRVIGFAKGNSKLATLYNDGLEIGSTVISQDEFKRWQVAYVKAHPNDLPLYTDFFYELDYETAAADILFYSVKASKDSFWVNTSIGLYQFNFQGALQLYVPVHALDFNFTADGKLIESNFYHGTRVYSSLNPMTYTYYDERLDKQHPRFVVGSELLGTKTYLTSIFNGLYAYNDGNFTSYAATGIWKEKRLRYITAYGEGKIAITNEDGDLFILEDEAQNFKVTPVNRNKAYGSTITFLTSYKDYLIIGTSKGVVILQKGRELFLNKEQGVTGKVYSGFIRGDELLLGTDNGYYEVQLKKLIDQESRVDFVTVKSVLVNGKEMALDSNSRLELATDQNSLEIQLNTNNHPYPEKLEYSYRLDTSQEWISINNATLTLPFLEPGTYSLLVQVVDASTGYVLEQQVLDFHIATPFYKQLWFIVLCFIVAMTLLVIYFRLKRKRDTQRSKEKEALTKRVEEVKLEALLAQMNPHFVFNSLNSVQYFISNQENEKAMHYLSTFSNLMRANLNNTSKPFLTIAEEIDYLQKYIAIENARFGDRIEVNISVDPELSKAQTSIPTMILQPFVENAFVHAFPSRIESPRLDISFEALSSQEESIYLCQMADEGSSFYRCIIQDNGIGTASLTKNKRHVSKGTQLIRERLSLLGYDAETGLQVKYCDTGTTVILILER